LRRYFKKLNRCEDVEFVLSIAMNVIEPDG